VRLLGVDYGTKRIGLAVSDELGFGAYPLATLNRSRRLGHDLDEIARHAAREQAGRIVVGLPLNADGSHGPAAEAATQFARSLAKHTPLPIALHDEFLTTWEAQEDLLAADVSRKRRRAVIDQMAAVKILEGFLRAEKERTAAAQLSKETETI
jgi:putative Holliday junction resolvase